MDFDQLVSKNRSYRRFHQDHPLSKETLLELVGLAGKCPSAANRQSLRFVCSCSPEKNRRIFETLAWAAYLPQWPGPAEGERPAGYIIILADPSQWHWVWTDLGIAAQTILLEAVRRGLGGCMIGNIKKEPLRSVIDAPPHLDILLVIALGKPAEAVVLEAAPTDGSIKYYRTGDGVHHVPKRRLEDLVLGVYA